MCLYLGRVDIEARVKLVDMERVNPLLHVGTPGTGDRVAAGPKSAVGSELRRATAIRAHCQ